MKDYEITLKVRNNFLLTAMRRKVFETAAALSRATGVSQTRIGAYLNLRDVPLLKDGHWRPCVERIAEVLDCTPFDLFPPQHIDAELPTNTGTITVSAVEMTTLIMTSQEPVQPDRMLEKADAVKTLSRALETLPPRLERITRQRFGIGCEPQTLDEIATEQGVTRERIRQMESRAVRMLGLKRAGLIVDGEQVIDLEAVA